MQSFVSRFILGFALLSFAACTTPIPVDPNQPKENQKEEKDLVSKEDLTQLTQTTSLFSKLAQDPTTLDQWEKSDGWVMYYQGKLHEAIEAFGSPNPQNGLGLARAHLELADSYQHFAESTERVVQEWLMLERQSPHAERYALWLDWTELTIKVHIEGLSALNHEGLKQLNTRLISHPEMHQWAKVAVELNPDHQPAQASQSYRLWLEFAQQVTRAKTGNQEALKIARKKQSRLMKRQGRALIQPVYSTQPDPQHPEHKVYDPRLASIHRDYHALEALEALSSLSSDPWSKLLQARASLLLKNYAHAIELLASIIQEEKTLTPPSDAFLLLTSNLSQAEVLNETRARLVHAHCALNQLEQATSSYDQLRSISPQSINQNIWSLWASATCPKLIGGTAQMTEDQLKLFPQVRRPLIQAVSERIKGPAAERLASLGVAERWLDELQYHYAWAMSTLDHRVPALKALSSAEDSRSPMRLGGHNRLHRLSLSATHQINLRRLRVASKYFLRLREQLPAVAALAEMTSDVLSGTSFSVTGQVNAGQ